MARRLVKIDNAGGYSHSGGMIFRLHRVVVIVLLLLVPLQATAVLTICPHAKSAAARQMSEAPAAAMQDCTHGQAGNGDASRDGGDNQSCCAMAAGCALCGVASNALPLQGVIAHVVPAAHYGISSTFTSFVPEGLQRPPSFLAQ
jgi:hypothetical protein